MNFFFNFVFWIVVIITGAAVFLHTSAGEHMIGTLFHYSGISDAEKKAAERRARNDAVRTKASGMSAAVQDELGRVHERLLQQAQDASAETGGGAPSLLDHSWEAMQERSDLDEGADVIAQTRDAQQKARDDQERELAQGASPSQPKDVEALNARVEALHDKVEAAQERADAQRERMQLQKERMDAKAAK